MNLFTSIAGFNLFSDGNPQIKWSAIAPSVEHAEDKYIIPITGQAYLDLLIVRDKPEIATPQEAILIGLLRKALASFALYEYSYITAVQISDKGNRRGDSLEEPTAYKYQVDELRKTLLDRGYLQLEKAIEALEVLAAANQAPLWVESPQYAAEKALLIPSGNQFAQIISQVRYPRRMFLMLRSTMLNVQELTIRPLITNEIYNELLAHNRTIPTTFTNDEKGLLLTLKNAIANLTMYKGIPTLIAQMDEHGLHVLSNNADANNTTSKRTAASDTQLNILLKHYESTAEAWLANSINYINAKASISVWPLWYANLQASKTTPVSNDVNETLSGCAFF